MIRPRISCRCGIKKLPGAGAVLGGFVASFVAMVILFKIYDNNDIFKVITVSVSLLHL